MDNILNYIIHSTQISFFQIAIIFIPLISLAIVMNLLSAYMEKKAYLIFGKKIYLYLFAWLGTFVHECGHALFCIIFRHKIDEIKFFDPSGEESLGHVNHSYNRKSFYQTSGNFFIGIGPIILGALTLWFAAYFLIDFSPDIKISEMNSGTQIINRLASAFVDNLKILMSKFNSNSFQDWKFYLFFYILFSVGSSITLSKSDISSSLKGGITIIILILLFNFSTAWMGNFVSSGFEITASFLLPFYSIMILCLILEIIVSLIFLTLSILVK